MKTQTLVSRHTVFFNCVTSGVFVCVCVLQRQNPFHRPHGAYVLVALVGSPPLEGEQNTSLRRREKLTLSTGAPSPLDPESTTNWRRQEHTSLGTTLTALKHLVFTLDPPLVSLLRCGFSERDISFIWLALCDALCTTREAP